MKKPDCRAASSKPSFEAAAQLAKALGLSLDFLAGLDVSNDSSPLQAEVAAILTGLSQDKLKAIKTLVE